MRNNVPRTGPSGDEQADSKSSLHSDKPVKAGMIDIKSNRRSRKWSKKAQVGRLLWDICSPAFALSPRQFWFWRRSMLRLFGASIAGDVHIYPSAKISIPWNLTIGRESSVGDKAILYALGPITIGPQTTVSQYAHICAGSHDYQAPDMELTKPAIVIGEGVWICADAFVGPGVSIGDRAVIGARCVVMRDAAEDTVYVGNPAKQISRRQIT